MTGAVVATPDALGPFVGVARGLGFRAWSEGRRSLAAPRGGQSVDFSGLPAQAVSPFTLCVPGAFPMSEESGPWRLCVRACSCLPMSSYISYVHVSVRLAVARSQATPGLSDSEQTSVGYLSRSCGVGERFLLIWARPGRADLGWACSCF